eukprot:scaffold1573_cov173-Amphora_coffeaeformis.AAC.13
MQPPQPTDITQGKDDNDDSIIPSDNVDDNDETDEKLPTLHHRFVRLNPRFDKEETLRLLKVSRSAC